MKWGVVTFPGSLDDRDSLYCLERGKRVSLWHKDRDLHGVRQSSCRAASHMEIIRAAARLPAFRPSFKA